MTEDLTRSQLEDLISWWPILDDVAESLLGITGHGVSLAGPTGESQDSSTELAVIQLDQIQQLSRDMTALARLFGWRGWVDGQPRYYAAMRLSWARSNLNPVEYEPAIATLHAHVARLTGHAPRPTNRTCPACGETQLTITDQGLHCLTCDLTRTPDEIQALTTWRITTSATTAPLPLVAHHLGIPASTIRTWISRGHLTRETDGTIHIPTARTLKARLEDSTRT